MNKPKIEKIETSLERPASLHEFGLRIVPIIATLFLSACATNSTVESDDNANLAVDQHQQESHHFSNAYHHDNHRSEIDNCTVPGDQALNSVVRVAAFDGGDASGVVIANDRVLTAAHAINNDYRALVRIDNEYRHALVLAVDESRDLALLAVETGYIEPIRLSLTMLHSEESVWTVGFPLALAKTTNHGHYRSNVNGAIYASAATNAGASGGGLLRCENGRFELAGMIRAYGAYRRGNELQRIEDLSISVPAHHIFDFALNAGVTL